MRSGDVIQLVVTLAGVDVTHQVERFRARFGFDQRVAECEIDFAATPAVPSFPGGADWATIQIEAGLMNPLGTIVPETGLPPAGLAPRFTGIVLADSVDHWPYTLKLHAIGYLGLADRFVVPDDLWADQLVNANPYVTAASYDPPGVDMSNNQQGQTDSDQILYVLGQAGLTSRIVSLPSDIGGLAYLLGQIAPDQFVWRRGQSALSYIEQLDGMYGFRTFETPNGTIQRVQTSSLVPLFSTVTATINENTNIVEGASLTRTIDQIRNRVVVSGFDDGTGDNVFVGIGSGSPLPPGQTFVSEAFSNPLIEHLSIGEVYPANTPDAGQTVPGLSCEEVATYWLNELQYPVFEAVVPTWRDDVLQPGNTIYLNAPHLFGVNQAMWLKHLEIEVTPNSFTQYLTLRAQDYSVFRGPTTLPLSLGV